MNIQPLNNYYGLILSIAFFFSFLYLFLSSYKKNFPLIFQLMIGTLFSIPFLILGFRIWSLNDDKFLDKLNDFYSLNDKIKFFFGVNDGFKGLSFHGGFLFGFIYYLFFFNWYSRKTKISRLYLFDWLIPSILIMQIIGRFGNYLNDEIWGKNNEPLFLYESIGNFIILIIILFIVPNFYKFVSKKPWIDNKFLESKLLDMLNNVKKEKNILIKIKLYLKYLNQKNIYWNNSFKSSLKSSDFKAIKIWNTQNFFYIELNKILNEKKFWKRNIKKIKLYFLRDSRELLRINNPLNFKFIKVGVISCLYVILSFSLRLGLQFLRKPEDAMKITIYFLIFCILIAIIFLFLFQFVFPKKFRSVNWFYESRY